MHEWQPETKAYVLLTTERLLGTCPPKEAYRNYILSKAPVPDDEETLAELDSVQTSVGGDDGPVTGFHRDADGIYLLDYQVKGFLKESGNNMKGHVWNAKTKKCSGIKNLKSKLDNFVFVFPRWIWLAQQPAGQFARPLRAETAMGPRVCIATSEYLDPGIEIRVKISIMPNQEIGWETIAQLLDYGRYKGIGQFRNGSFGRFEYREVAELAAQ